MPKMTIEQLLSCPKGMSFQEYLKQLELDEKKAKRLRRLSSERDFLEDALEVLQDEKGSERYEKKSKRLTKVNEEIMRLAQ